MGLETTLLKEVAGLETTISKDGQMITRLGPTTETMVLVTEVGIGLKGDPGLTPYEEWLAKGNEGTYQDFLGSLGNGGLGNLSQAISADANNRLKIGEDEKLFVQDDFTPDPLAYYILAKG